MAKIIKNNLGNLLVVCFIFLMIACWWFSGIPKIWQEPPVPPEVKEVLAAPDKKIEQQINIIDQEYKTGSESYVPTDNRLGLIKWDSSQYSDASVYFEAVIQTASPDHTVFAALYSSGGVEITNSGVEHAGNTSYTRVRSGVLPQGSLPNLQTNTDYTVQIKCSGAVCGTVFTYIKAARLIIVQSTTTGNYITNTETQVEVGNNSSTTQTTYTDLTDKKIYLYDQDKFDPNPTINFQATLKAGTYEGTPTDSGPRSPNSSSDVVSDSSNGEEIAWTTPGNAYSQSNTYAVATLKNNQSHYLKATNFGFTIPSGSTIKGIKVEIDRYSVLAGDDTARDLTVSLVKGGTVQGGNKADTTTDWPTTDTGTYKVYPTSGWETDLWGLSWTVTDINASNFGVVLAANINKTGGPNDVTCNVDHMRITVRYALSVTETAYAILYDITANATVTASEISVATDTWKLASTSASFSLTDDREYSVQIKSSNAGAIASIANAKIILTQASSTGIDAVEIVHQYVNTEVSEKVHTWTAQDFDNLYDANNFTGGTFNYLFEATIYMQEGDAARLTPGALGTVGGSDGRLRSGIISLTDDTEYDTEIVYCDAHTSWLIIQASGLAAAEPSITCTTPMDGQINYFGTITNSAIAAATTSSTTVSSGGSIYMRIYSQGSGSNPGLWKTPDLIESPTAANPSNATDTLQTNAEGYGIMATTTGTKLVIATRYNNASSTNIVGGLSTSTYARVVASSSVAVSPAEVVYIDYKVSVSVSTPFGTYEDIIYINCTAE